MGTPQIIVLVLYGIGMLVSANRHGQERKPENFWTTLISLIIMFSLLIWGGFFN